MVHRRLALVRRPSPRLADGIVTHVERSPWVDVHLALRQWEEYCAALGRRGWEVLEAPPSTTAPTASSSRTRSSCSATSPCSAARVRRRDGPSRPAFGSRWSRSATDACRSRRPAPSTAATSSSRAARSGSASGAGQRAGIAELEQAVNGHRSVESRFIGCRSPGNCTSSRLSRPSRWHGHRARGNVDDQRRWPDFLGRARAGRCPRRPARRPVRPHVRRRRPGRRTCSRAGTRRDPVDISEFEKLEGCVTCLSVRLRG